jgi:hypothetical protein
MGLRFSTLAYVAFTACTARIEVPAAPTFGDVGTIGAFNTGDLNAGAGLPGFITKDTPLHSGPIGL